MRVPDEEFERPVLQFSDKDLMVLSSQVGLTARLSAFPATSPAATPMRDEIARPVRKSVEDKPPVVCLMANPGESCALNAIQCRLRAAPAR